MRIILANDYLAPVGGAEKVVSDLYSFLIANGHQVELFGSPRSRETFFSFFDRWFSLKNFINALTLIDTFHPDLIHAHNLSRAISPSILVAAKIKKIPICLTFHDCHLICPKTWMIFENSQPCPYGFGAHCLLHNCHTFNRGFKYYPYQWLKWLKVALHRFIIRRTVSLAICPSRHLQNWVEKSLGLKTVYLPNFFSGKIMPKIPSKTNRFFLYVGRLSPEKGVLSLVDTFRLSSPSDKLVIIGDGPEKFHLQQSIKRYHLTSRVKLLGSLPNQQIYQYYRQAIALIIPSICQENNPLVALEALSQGTPLIVSAYGGLPDFLSNGAVGIIYHSPSELTRALSDIRYLQSPVTLPKIYLPKTHFTKLLSLYSDLIYSSI